jgi:type III restriction enzyme
MICELFPFQKQAVNEMRLRVAMALNNYRMLKIPQVVSLQAPTGSGKTIIMSALIEDIFYGSEQFTEQPEAIFVWLSDSPQLNEQSKQKIELKADKVRMDQCVVISDESFDREILEDGHIYFLNTQKLGKAGNLSRHSDTRQYTIWETIENTAREKADRLYFIIDEAHRGMQGRQAGTATTIMQRFIKGSSEQNLSPIPVVIGMSATAERFNSLVGQATNSTLHKVVISPAQVRQSGLLKDRIVITYPEDPIKHGDMAVLQAATDEWQDKCKHWYQYTYEQHYTNVNPVFVIQVCAGSGTKVSDTDLDDVIAKIEERMGDSFKENEVVHTFGSTGTLSIHGLTVPHIEPSEIAEDRRIRVVLFKENLSTGWDCPRAETMMSFRRAEDATYIAQLLGRMVRTPLQCHVLVDDSLNDVRLFLPYFNQDTVQKVIDELQATEGGEIPTVVDGESLEEQNYDTWSVHNQRKKTQKQTVGQLSIFDYPNGFQEEPAAAPSTAVGDMSNSGAMAANQGGADAEIPAEGQHQTIPLEAVSGNDVHAGQETEKTSGGNQSVNKEQPVLTPAVSQMSMFPTIDREGITKFINEQGYLTYIVRAVKINSYLKSLMSLAGLLSQFNICITAAEDVKNDVAELIRNYVNGLHDAGKYDELTKQVMEMKLSVQIFDVFGEKIQSDNQIDMFTASESDLDRQLRVADAKMGGCGFHLAYGRKYIDFDNPNAFKVDCILFAFDSECIAELNKYAEKKFHELNDQYRKYIVAKPEKCQKQYSDIVANGDEISKHNFTLPETISAKVEADGIKYTDHLFANADGIAKIKLNGWEQAVLAEEQKREDVKWDFLIIDEAHNLRNVFHGTKRAKNLYDLTHGIPKILLTATPLQNSLTDLHGLVSFIDPRIFGSEKVFNRRFVDGCDYEELKQELLPVLYRTLRRDVGKYMAFSKRTCITVDFHLSTEEKELYDVTNDFLRRDPLYSIPNANRGLIILVIRKLLASSSFALIETFEVLEKRLEKLYEGTKSAYAQEGFDLFWGFVEDEIDEDGFNEYDDEETAEKKQASRTSLNSAYRK